MMTVIQHNGGGKVVVDSVRISFILFYSLLTLFKFYGDGFSTFYRSVGIFKSVHAVFFMRNLPVRKLQDPISSLDRGKRIVFSLHLPIQNFGLD
jgi:hypothetical protein